MARKMKERKDYYHIITTICQQNNPRWNEASRLWVPSQIEAQNSRTLTFQTHLDRMPNKNSPIIIMNSNKTAFRLRFGSLLKALYPDLYPSQSNTSAPILRYCFAMTASSIVNVSVQLKAR